MKHKLCSLPLFILLALFASAVTTSPLLAAERGAIELCSNSIDDDGDGAVDEAACRLSPSGSPISAGGVVPETWGDNPNCKDLGYAFGFKIDSPVSGVNIPIGDGINSVDIIVSDGGRDLEWTSTLGIDAVFIKGGPGGNLYVYNPESMGDSGLSTPANQQISHVEWCYDYELAAEKTAVAEFTRTYTWQIEKAVDPASHTGWFGDDFVSTYTVSVDQTVEDGDFMVTGEIEVHNPTPFAVTFSVADSVDGLAAAVVCPTYTLGPGASTTCTYSVDLLGPANGTNTATVTVSTGPVGGATATADYAFGEPTTIEGDETINIFDYFDGGAGELLGSASADKTFTYDRSFECSSDEGDYSGGSYTRSFPNYAEIDETDQQDNANVDLTCYKPVVSKDADTVWYERYDWTITKSVSPASHTGFPGDTFESDYSVFVDQTVTQYGYRAFGTIYVTNPHPSAALTVSLSDAVDGFAATLDCGGSLNVAAGTTETCGYTVDLPNNTDRTNTATATFNGIAFVATATVDFGAPVIEGFPTISVTDYFDGGEGTALGSASADHTFEYTGPFECPTTREEYNEQGTYERQFPNFAEIDQTSQQGSAFVDITCYWPADARVIKATIEGPEDIGAFPIYFELRNPDGILVETATLNAAGEVAFATEFTFGDEGIWTVLEVEFGWTAVSLTCSFEIAFPDSAGQTYTCDFDNTENSRVQLVKLTNGEPTTSQVWTFALYLAANGGFGSEPLAVSSTPSADGVLTFGFGSSNDGLNPDSQYALCELGVPAGYSSFWQIDTNGDGIPETTVIPYNPNADDVPPEDLGNRCIDIGPDSGILLVPGTTLHVMVNNTAPGGSPRTPGYWKNWNRCTIGGQAGNADRNGGWEEGFWLLEDVLNPAIGGGIVWDDNLVDNFVYPITNCEQAVKILDKRRTDTGLKVASDPLHNLAAHLLAAQLNFGAGACTTLEALDAALMAETLLDKYNFNGAGHDALAKKSADVAYAYALAGTLDAYNNGEFCGDFGG